MGLKFFEALAAKRIAHELAQIDPRITQLIARLKRENQKLDEDEYLRLYDVRGLNSYERRALLPYFDDKLLIKETEACLLHCQQYDWIVYDGALQQMFVPELIKRLQAAERPPLDIEPDGA